ncbi:MAG: DinB family protein [Chloroflexi bacterium]|nr:DinB family protein [Chloroflexota bacterium]
MDANLKSSLWNQFGAAIDTLDDALTLCPDSLWETVLWDDEEDARYGQFWFIAYHTLFWTDLFLGGSYADFTPPAPFIRGTLPDQPYAKDDVHAYLKACRAKVKAMSEALTDEQAARVCTFPWMTPSYLELQFYSLRHVQEHAAQLNLILGHRGITGQDWVAKARDNAQM